MRPRSGPQRGLRDGFTLVEVMISMVLLFVGILAVAAQLPAGLRLLVESGDTLQQTTIMAREMERVEATPFSDLQLGTTSWIEGAFKVARTIRQGPAPNTLLVVVQTKAPFARAPRKMATVVAASW